MGTRGELAEGQRHRFSVIAIGEIGLQPIGGKSATEPGAALRLPQATVGIGRWPIARGEEVLRERSKNLK